MAAPGPLKTRANYLRKPEQVGERVTSGGSKKSTSAKTTDYDVIIVGGGTAALVLAHRLTESSAISVLVLEAGQSGMAVDLSVMPVTFGKLFFGEHSWNYTTVPQKHTTGLQNTPYPRGKLLGGCSSVNAMMFHHCAPTDYDEWARLAGPGAEDWAYEPFRKYLRKIETFVPHKEITAEVTERGNCGAMKTGYHNYRSETGAKFLKACDAAGIPNVDDVNTPKGTLGSTYVPTYICPKGKRVSSESAYLTMDVLARPNLTIATKATVTKVLFQIDGDTKVAAGVEFTDAKGTLYRARAKKEVVMSAGAIGTPHILMLSGVGPAEQISRYNIPLVHDLPGVGASLMDHPQIPLRLKLRPGTSINYLTQPNFKNTARTVTQVLKWKTKSKSHATSIWQEVFAFARSTDPDLFPESGNEVANHEDSTSGKDAPDLELMFAPITYSADPNFALPPGDYCTLTSVLLRPTSIGTVGLKSENTKVQPAIDPNFLATEHDVETLVRGLKLLMKIAKSEPFASMIDLSASADHPELDTKIFDMNDSQLREIVKQRAFTIFHPTSTARMAPLEDGGVVDSKLRVHGIPNLRVVDASAFPSIPAGHTSAPVLAMAEKASDIMRAEIRVFSEGQERQPVVLRV